MIQSFRHRGLQRLYERGDRSRINPALVEKVETALGLLDVADPPEAAICRVTGCIRCGVICGGSGASASRATGGLFSGSMTVMCAMWICLTITREEQRWP